MLRSLRHPRLGRLLAQLSAVCLTTALIGGCGGDGSRKPEPAKPRYTDRGLKAVPAYLKDTILERADLENTAPFPVSGYGLVSGLRGTGENTVPLAVREYMIRMMAKHGFGMPNTPGYGRIEPETVLRDPSFSIVRVDGFVPPGARKDDMFDVQVSALDESNTTSLSHGKLFDTDLRLYGADPMRPSGSVNVYARASGPVFVNPAYALRSPAAATQSSVRASLRFGMIMDGGQCKFDNTLALMVRQPQWSTARAIEYRIDQRFQDPSVAAAKDEGRVYLYVPREYRGDWEHFAGVATHLFRDASPEFSALKAKQLAQEAVKPDAPLQDISYCWEGLGPEALPFVLPLLSHASPDVAFAAARAAAFLRDPSGSAHEALMGFARTPDHPFQINAVQTLGALESSPMIDQMLRRLLDSDQTLVRIEAYRVLARNQDPVIYSKVIQEKFVLDLVPSKGPPLIYASRRGYPRLAIFGLNAALNMPLTFTAMDSKLSLSSGGNSRGVTIFYRGEELPEPIKQVSLPDLAQVVARLAGEGAPAESRFDFSYGDIVALVQALSDARKLSAQGADGERVPTAFVLQELPRIQDSIYNTPHIPDLGRPQEEAPPIGSATPEPGRDAGINATAAPAVAR